MDATNEAARRIFDDHAAQQRAAGDLDGAANTELLREYFTNADFRAALETEIWRITKDA